MKAGRKYEYELWRDPVDKKGDICMHCFLSMTGLDTLVPEAPAGGFA
jgi:hypothetical protein